MDNVKMMDLKMENKMESESKDCMFIDGMVWYSVCLSVCIFFCE